MKNHYVVLLALLLPIRVVAKDDFIKITENQGTTTHEQIINSFLRPVKFSGLGLKNFFIERFNAPLYAERFLPSCFIHVIDFFEYGVNRCKEAEFFESVLDLFHQRLKESTWVNPYALIAFMERLPEFFDFLYDDQEEKIKDALRDELEQALLKNFNLLKADPAAFLDQTAETLMQTVNKNEKAHDISKIQVSLLRFLEGSMGKLIWNPYDKIDVWKSFKLLCKKCELLYSYRLVESMNDVNQLVWSLLYRFGYFIECAGSQMDPDFYETVRTEIEEDALPFLQIEEQEEWIESKAEYLDRILTQGEIKAHAHKQGIYSDIAL